jgi:hypothetical protein
VLILNYKHVSTAGLRVSTIIPDLDAELAKKFQVCLDIQTQGVAVASRRIDSFNYFTRYIEARVLGLF